MNEENDVIVYECDPEKNIECDKTMCGTMCFHTRHAEYSVDGRMYRYNADKKDIEPVDG